MDETLRPIGHELAALEFRVMAEYVAQADPGQRYLELPPDRTRVLQQQLFILSEQLYRTGDPSRLTIVTDLHDELRVRMIYLRNLLARDIPVPYLAHALPDPEPRAAAAQRPRAGAAASEAATAPGVLTRLLGGLFGRKPAAPAAAPQGAAGRPHPQARGAAGTGRTAAVRGGLAEETLQLLLIHQLMEEDRLKLVKPGQLLPRTDRIRLPEAVREQVARKISAAEGIARTPEELRRKLAARAKRNAELGWSGGGSEGPSRFRAEDRAETHFAVAPSQVAPRPAEPEAPSPPATGAAGEKPRD